MPYLDKMDQGHLAWKSVLVLTNPMNSLYLHGGNELEMATEFFMLE